MPGKITLYLEELRAPFFTASTIPVLLGTAIVWCNQGYIHWGYFVLTLVGGVCMHAGTNIANDYFEALEDKKIFFRTIEARSGRLIEMINSKID